MSEGRIAAEHLAIADMHHAPADRIAELKSHLVEAFKRQPCPRPRASRGHDSPVFAGDGQTSSRHGRQTHDDGAIGMQKSAGAFSAPTD